MRIRTLSLLAVSVLSLPAMAQNGDEGWDMWYEAEPAAPELTTPTTPAPATPATPAPGGVVDQPAGAWAQEAVQLAVEQGCFIGYPDGTFRWTEPLTRQEAAMVLYRLVTEDNMCGGQLATKADLETVQKAIEELQANPPAPAPGVPDTAAMDQALATVEQRLADLETRVANLEGALQGPDRNPFYIGFSAYRQPYQDDELRGLIMLGHDSIFGDYVGGNFGLRASVDFGDLEEAQDQLEDDAEFGDVVEDTFSDAQIAADVTYTRSFGMLDWYAGLGGGIVLIDGELDTDEDTGFGEMLTGVNLRVINFVSLFGEARYRYMFNDAGTWHTYLTGGLQIRF